MPVVGFCPAFCLWREKKRKERKENRYFWATEDAGSDVTETKAAVQNRLLMHGSSCTALCFGTLLFFAVLFGHAACWCGRTAVWDGVCVSE